jgi:DNA repair protein RadC
MTAQPAADRPRERLAREGPSVLSDVELVAVQLGSGKRGQSATEMATELLVEWGGVAGLARADAHALGRRSGIGPAKASRLVSAFALGARSGSSPEGVVVTSSAEVAAVVRPLLYALLTEAVLVVVLDGAHRVRRVERVASGGSSHCAVSVRDVLGTVLRYDGVAFALAHNHPGGDPAPSSADVTFTGRLQEASHQVGLRMLDHVVIAHDRWRSITAS